MHKDEALEYMASKLALNTWDHLEQTKKLPGLAENTRIVGELNRECCITLGVAEKYDFALSLLTRSG